MTRSPHREPVAIVGIGCRFPGGVADPAGFWRALVDRLDAVGEVPADRFDAEALFHSDGPAPGRIASRYGGFLDGIDRFDAAFFGIAPREAELLDPQQRLLLETACEALDDAGQTVASLRGGRAGVYVGLWLNDYEARLFADPAVEFHMTTGSGRYAASGRISYALGLQGPSLTVDTACSSSLVAVHLACRSLWSGECPVALAGGANVILQPHVTIAYSQSGMMAADGRCRFGDARAGGYVRSEGAAMVVLKPLSRALADGDRVYALIRGSAVNNDGRSGDYMATPARAGQEQMLRLAYADAGVPPGRVDYVEAHGTGTAAGDPVELGALGAVLTESREPGVRCVVGSVKTNFGHTEGAAGVAGLIKAALVLKHGEAPASLHLRTPNPAIPWSELPFFVAAERTPLEPRGRPLLAGVSSFGIAGTNAHVVLEQAPAEASGTRQEERGADADRVRGMAPVLVPLSAHTAEALAANARRWADHAGAAGAPSLADRAHTAALRRDHHEHRLAVVADDDAALAAELDTFAGGVPGPSSVRGSARPTRPRVVFVFPGQGSQWVGMGRELSAGEPAFRAALDACEAAMRPWVDWSLREQLLLDEGDPRRLDRIDVVQPMLVSLDIALAALWRDWGIEPDAVIGHSMGEVAAACVAGALSLDDAMRVICVRSRLMRRISGHGAMAVVELPREAAAAALAGREDRVAVAASNSPRSTILAGEPAALDAVLASLEARDVFCRRVNVDVASHSPQVEPLRADLLRELDGIEPRVPGIAFHSTVLARRIDGAELDAEYWVRNLRQPVLLGDTVATLAAAGHDTFLEVSPHPVLLPALQQTLQHAGGDAVALGSTRRAEPERAALLRSLGELWAAGATVAWERVNPPGRHAALPTYAWQRERFWYDPPARRTIRRAGGGAHPIFGEPVRGAAGHRLWEAELDTAAVPLLADHRVRDRPLLPAAAVLELGLHGLPRAGPDADTGAAAVLESWEIEQPVPVGEAGTPTPVQALLEPDTPEAATLTLFGGGADGEWTRCARGRVVVASAAGVPRRPAPIAPPEGEGAPAEAHYRALGLRGLPYGPAFRAVERVWAGEGRATGRLRLPESLRPEAGRYRIHPVLLDGAFQLVLRTLTAADAEGTWVPVGLRRLRLHRSPDPATPLLARAVREPDGAELVARLLVQDEQGRPVLEAEGVRFRAVAVAERPEDRTYRIEWTPQPLPAGADPAAGAASPVPAGDPGAGGADAGGPGAWLLLGDRGGLAEALCDRLEAAGASCTVVHRAGHTAGAEATDGAGIDARRPDAFDAVLAAASTPGPLRGIVHLWGLDAAPVDDAGTDADALDAAQAAGTLSLLHLVQALLRTAPERLDRPRLCVVTRGAQAVAIGTETEPVPALTHAPLWGMAAVVANENPELGCGCIDLDPAGADVDRLAAELLGAAADARIAWRGGQRFAARLVPHAPAAATPPANPATRRIPAPYAVVTTGAGVLDNLRAAPRARRAPRAGQVEIEVRAVGLNFMNVMSALGVYPGYPDGLGPLGIECAGVVVATGGGVDRIRVGDEVVAFAFDCLATHALADARLVAPRPPALSWEQAATVPIAFLTASWGLERLGRLAPGERVLIHSAAGGVGLAAVQIARAAGAEIHATAGTEAKREFLRSLGIRHVWDSRSLDFADRVLEATGGEGVDVVLNSLAGEAVARGLGLLRPFGRFVELGKRDVHGGRRVDLSPFRNQIVYTAVDLDRTAREHPELLGPALRKVVERVAAGELTPLPSQGFPISRAAEAFATMAQGAHTGKIVIEIEPAARTTAPAGALRDDASYLVTGGLGALGIEVARWMVNAGARHLVLVGRGEPSAAARDAIAGLEAVGARIRVERADVASESELARVLATIDESMPTLRGVVHAAGLLADATLPTLDEAGLRAVLAPKLRGAWNLHRLTRSRPLDLFVLFSSVSATLGIPGQANYAAANAFLDALAHHRRAAGLPALSLGWGPWREVGLAAERAERGHRLADRGLGGLPTAVAIAALDAWVREPALPHAVVARLDADAWCGAHPATSTAALLERLRRDADGGPAEAPAVAGSAARDRILAAAGRDRKERLEAFLRETAAQVLRLPAARIAPNQPLKALGMDSLMSLELRNRVEAQLGLALSATTIWNYPTVALLAGHLLGRLEAAAGATASGDGRAAGDGRAGGAASDPAAADKAAGTDEIVDLDAARLESLLDRELAAIDDLLGGDS